MSFLRRPHPHRTTTLSDAPRRRLLFVVLALVLASGAFAALGANEARAAEEDRQLPKAQHQQQRPTLPIGGEAAETDGGMVVGPRSPVEKPPTKLPSAKPPPVKPPPTQTPPPVDSTPPAPRPEPAPRPGLGSGITFSLENDAEAEGSGTSLAREVSHEKGVFAQQTRYYGAETLPADPKPPAFVPPLPQAAASVPEQADSEPAPPPSSEPKPERSVGGEAAQALGEEDGRAPLRVEESPRVPSWIDEGASASPPPEDRPAEKNAAPSATAPHPSPAVTSPQPPMSPQPMVASPQPPIGLGAALGSAAQKLGGIAASVSGSLSGGASGPATEGADPLGGTTPAEPTTPLPTTPVSYGGFSPSGGGQASGGGGVAPLFLCILASGLILLCRDGRLTRALSYVPKPSSALLTPLERPG